MNIAKLIIRIWPLLIVLIVSGVLLLACMADDEKTNKEGKGKSEKEIHQ